MSVLINSWKHSELALAAYAPLVSGMVGDGYSNVLEGNGMTVSQAEYFSRSWRVITQHNDRVSGLSATVFEEVISGNRYLAIRGTQPTDAGDVGTDLLIIFSGYEINLSSQYRQLKTKVGEWLADGTLQQGFTVSGHSLGGFLATGLAADFADSISHAYLYNAPGLNGVLGGATAPILQAFGITAPVDAAKISNIKADAGLSPIAGLGAQVSSPIWIAIENQFFSDISNPPPARNHAQEILTDALAVYAVYGALMPALTAESMASIIHAASVQNKTSLESTLDVLRKVILGEMQATVEGDRDDFYRNLYALQQDEQYKALIGKVTFCDFSVASAEVLAAEAKESFGSFLALNYLLPFTIDGATDVLAQSYPDLYSIWLEDQIKRAGEQTDMEYSDQWLRDRATLLIWKEKYFSADGQVALRGGDTETYIFEIKDLNEPDLSLTVVGHQRLSVVSPGKVVFGSSESETITGSDIRAGDRLYAGDGDDTLIAGGGNDLLEGGRGFDTYVIESGMGFVSIYDADGTGRVVVDGAQAGKAYEITDGFYVSLDKKFEYYFDGNPSVSGTLFINGGVQISDFQNGDMGIFLNDAGASDLVQETDVVFINDPTHQYGLGTNLRDYFLMDLLTPDYSQGDIAYLGFGGNDLMLPADPVIPYLYQYAFGGSGDDILVAGPSHLEGGGGRDVLLGNSEDNDLFGDTAFHRLNFIRSQLQDAFELEASWPDIMDGDQPWFHYSQNVGQFWGGFSGNEYGPAIYFQDGFIELLGWLGMVAPAKNLTANDDLIFGGAGNDAIYGGAGGDTVYGDEGDDVIYGSSSGTGGALDHYNGSIAYLPSLEVKQSLRHLLISPGNDWLSGGAGNDKILDGDGGSDYMLGGDGHDILSDRDGDNTGIASFNFLDGGAGSDQLTSDNSSLSLSFLFGGEGNDGLHVLGGDAFLDGGAGDDVYTIQWYLSGQVEIDNNSEDMGDFDQLMLSRLRERNSVEEEVKFYRDELNLYIGYGEVRDRVIISGWFDGSRGKIDSITLNDFFRWPYETISRTYTAGDIDSLFSVSTAEDDFLWGGLAGDHLVALAGNDYLNGDAGDDFLEGGEGDDTYEFNADSGWDSVSDSAGENDTLLIHGVAPDDVFVQQTADQIRLYLGYWQRGIDIRWQPDYGLAIENIQFDNGISWDTQTLVNLARDGNTTPPTQIAPNPESEQGQLEPVPVTVDPVYLDNFLNPPSWLEVVSAPDQSFDTMDSVQTQQSNPESVYSLARGPQTGSQVASVAGLPESIDGPNVNSNAPYGDWDSFSGDADWPAQSGVRILLDDAAHIADSRFTVALPSPKQIALSWRRMHEHLDAQLARQPNEVSDTEESSLEMNFALGQISDSRFGLQGLGNPGISGHGLPVFARPFEGLREGLVPVA
jgi:Ca2+-binding RTX toxin-like protein